MRIYQRQRLGVFALTATLLALMGILAFGYTEIGEAHERVTRTLELESHLSSSRVWINRGSTEVLASIISGVAKGAVEATRASGTAAGSAFL